MCTAFRDHIERINLSSRKNKSAHRGTAKYSTFDALTKKTTTEPRLPSYLTQAREILDIRRNPHGTLTFIRLPFIAFP